MESNVLNKLNQAFTREQLRSRKGPNGREFKYIETRSVIARLNEALDADWSFEVVEHHILDKEIVVVGKLTVHSSPALVKTAFGSQLIKRSQKTGEALSMGDDLKAAASDALKKAATLLGVGLQLHSMRRSSVEAPRRQRPVQRDGVTIRDPDSPLSSRQLKAIERLAQSAGLTYGQLPRLVRERFDKGALTELSKSEASSLIKSLQH